MDTEPTEPETMGDSSGSRGNGALSRAEIRDEIADRGENRALIWYTQLLMMLVTVGIVMFIVVAGFQLYLLSKFDVMPADVIQEVRALQVEVEQLTREIRTSQ